MRSPGRQIIAVLMNTHMQGDEAFAAKLFTYATSQINYMLGDGGQSYVIGFGKDCTDHSLPQVVRSSAI